MYLSCRVRILALLMACCFPGLGESREVRVTVGGQSAENVHPLNVPFVESQLQRIDDIQSKLDELRERQTKILPQRSQKLAQQIQAIAQRMGAERDVDLAHLRGEEAALSAKVAAAEAEIQRLKPESFSSHSDFVRFDRLGDELDQLRQRRSRAQTLVRNRIREVAARDPEGAALVREAWDTDIEQAQVTRERGNVQARRDNVSRAARGAIGSYTARPEPAEGEPDMRISVAPPRDAVERLARFRQRNAPESVSALSQRFFAQINLSHPGLEEAAAHFRAGRHPQALDAYKRYFFRSAQRWQVEEDRPFPVEEQKEEEEEDPEAAAAFETPPTAVRVPHPAALEQAMSGELRFRIVIGQRPRRQVQVAINPGPAGAINWALPEYAPADATPDVKEALGALGQEMSHGWRLNQVLIDSYVVGGNREHLNRWLEVADDWSMNWARDIDNAPSMIRLYNMLIGYSHYSLVALLRNSASLRPDLVEDMPSTSLARLLLAANAEYTTSAIRLMRSGIYNFRIMMLNGMIPHSLGLQEFHVHQWAAREATRLAELNWVHKIRRDGANAELANAGHENTDGSLVNPMRILASASPDWLTPFWEKEFTRNLANNARYWVHMLKQDGRAFRVSTSPLNGHFAPEGSVKVSLLGDEPEVQARLWQVFDQAFPYDEPETQKRLWTERMKGGQGPVPQVRSESMAFAGYHFLRSGWKRSDFFFYLHGINQPVASERDDSNGFLLAGNGLGYVLAPPLYVDNRIQYHALDLPPSGGKSAYTVSATDVVKATRFHSSGHFDLAETMFDGPYAFYPSQRKESFSDLFGSYGMARRASQLRNKAQREGWTLDESPIRDVRHARQVLVVNDRSLYIVTDFVESPAPRNYEQFYSLPTPVRNALPARRVELAKKEGVLPVRVRPEERLIQVRNPGLNALDIHHFGNLPLEYWNAGAYDQRVQLKKQPKDAPVPYWQTARVGWKAEGDAVLTTVLAPTGAYYDKEPDLVFSQVRSIEGGEGVSGFMGTLEGGVPIYYAASVEPVRLGAGNLYAVARGFLRVGNRGVILGATSLESGGRTIPAPHADFEFSMERGFRVEHVIHRPIEPVRILPETTVFTDRLEVTLTTPTPDVEIRYTLDGSTPRHDSTLYTGPFTLAETSFVTARAFRKGLTHTPWVEDGTHATVSSWAVFERQALQPATPVAAVQPGLAYGFFRDVWPTMLAEGPSYPAEKSGVVPTVLDVGPREGTEPFGIRYEGYLEVPRDGVYTFHAPSEFLLPDNESGYDLRVYVNGKEWYPSTRWHAFGTWSVPLAQGRHAFTVLFVDMRRTPHRVEMQWGFPHKDFVWKGTAPELLISGPDIARQPIPPAWLSTKLMK